jgi:hypothetical protein
VAGATGTNAPGSTSGDFAYNSLTQGITGGSGATGATAILFTNHGITAGWALSPTSSLFTCTESGSYFVTYCLEASSSSTALAYDIAVEATIGGTPWPGSQGYLNATINTSQPWPPIAVQPLTRSFIVDGTAGATFALQAYSVSTTSEIVNQGTADTPISASTSFFRIY